MVLLMKLGSLFDIKSFVYSSLLIILLISYLDFLDIRVLLVTSQIVFFSIALIVIKKKLYMNFGVLILIILFIYIIIQNIVLQTESLYVFQSILMILILIMITQFSALNSNSFLGTEQYIKLSKRLLLFYPLLAISFRTWSETSSPGLYNNPNITGHISIMIIPLILIGIFDKKKLVMTLWFFSLVIVIVTESRSTLMAWALCLATYLVVKKIPKINTFGIIILVILTTIFSAYAIDIAVWLLFNSLNLSGQYDTRFLYLEYNSRDIIWEYASNRFYNQPFFGLGFGGSKFDLDGEILDTHNGYLEILIRLGLIGTFIFLIFILNLCYMISKSKSYFKPALIVSLVAIMSLATNSSTFFVSNYLFLYVNIIIFSAYVYSQNLNEDKIKVL